MSQGRKLCLGLVVWAFAGAVVCAEESAKLDPNQPYRAELTSPVKYDVDFVIAVTPPYQTKVLKVWLPLPPTDAAQQVSGRELATFPLAVEPRIATEPQFGNEFAYFEFAQPQGAQIIRHKFQITVHELHWNLDPAVVQRVSNWPAAFEPYLRSESQAVVVDERTRSVLDQIVPERHGPLADLEQVIRWAHGNLQYDHVNASLAASSVHALAERAGHCSDYHGLCAAFGRALGSPTRVTYGINPLPKSSPSHCKLEAFLPPYGWVSFDVSETQRLIAQIDQSEEVPAARKAELADAARRRLLQGFRDNTWYLQTRGTDYDLAPPAERRVPVVRTIYAEADGQSLPDPDPANMDQREFAWMTAHRYTPDRPVANPFQDWRTLEVQP